MELHHVRRVLSKDSLFSTIWGCGFVPNTRCAWTHFLFWAHRDVNKQKRRSGILSEASGTEWNLLALTTFSDLRCWQPDVPLCIGGPIVGFSSHIPPSLMGLRVFCKWVLKTWALQSALCDFHLRHSSHYLDSILETTFKRQFLPGCFMNAGSRCWYMCHSFGVCWPQLRIVPTDTFKLRSRIMATFAISVFQRMLEIDVNRWKTWCPLKLLILPIPNCLGLAAYKDVPAICAWHVCIHGLVALGIWAKSRWLESSPLAPTPFVITTHEARCLVRRDGK